MACGAFVAVECGKTFTEPTTRRFRVEDYLKDPRGLMAIRMLVEGCSIRTVERITEIRRDTIIALLQIAGERCETPHGRSDPKRSGDAMFRRMNAGASSARKRRTQRAEDSETMMATAIAGLQSSPQQNSCLPSWSASEPGQDAIELRRSFAAPRRPTQRFQLTTDGLRPYVTAVDDNALGSLRLRQLIKIYAAPREGEQRYSPGEVVEAVPVVISGNPDPNRICTSHVERQNLTMRMQIRRLTRLTNAFSKKYENHKAAIALHFAYYNFCQIHGSLRVTPAMEAGVTDHVWT